MMYVFLLVFACLVGNVESTGALSNSYFGTDADWHPSLRAPIGLQVNGKVISSWRNGACYADINQDGKRDLVYGCATNVHIAINNGTDNEPQFGEAELAMVAGKPFRGASSPAISGAVQVLDFNGDGHQDLLVGPTLPQLLLGTGKGDFELLVLARLKKERADVSDAEYAAGNAQTFHRFGIGRKTFFHATDWDKDGDFDILHGNNLGRVVLCLNSGDRKNHRFTDFQEIKIGDDNLLMRGGTSTPVHADWDGDGKRDLIVGSGNGEIDWFPNVGTDEDPLFEKSVGLVAETKGEFEGEEPDGSGKISIPFVVDFNGDGKMDLVVGDQLTQIAPPRELTEEQEESFEELRSRFDRITQEQSQLVEDFRIESRNQVVDSPEYMKTFRDMVSSVEEIEDYHIWGDLARQLGEYRDSPKRTGRIWVYLRK